MAFANDQQIRCPNCRQPGAHYVIPSFGEEGFYICDMIPHPMAALVKEVTPRD